MKKTPLLLSMLALIGMGGRGATSPLVLSAAPAAPAMRRVRRTVQRERHGQSGVPAARREARKRRRIAARLPKH